MRLRTLTALAIIALSAIFISAHQQKPTPTPTPTPDPHAGHDMSGMQAPPATGARGGGAGGGMAGMDMGGGGWPMNTGDRNESLPPDADSAKEQLSKSPRHAEWVDIKVEGMPPIKSFVVYPERGTKAPVVLVIHEIFGLSDWVRGVSDQLAKEGFIAIAPDFLSGRGPKGGGSDELGSDGSTKEISKVTQDDRNRILDAAMAYGKTLPSSTGKTATIGFCWGGGTSFSYALYQPALTAAVSYYGPMPSDPAPYAHAKPPIMGLYGGVDERVNANIPIAERELVKAGVTYLPNVFDGAGHGFLRQQSGQNGANMTATERAWPRTMGFLHQYLDGRAAPTGRR
jgi:carboxymethylenebutenolidase